MPLTTRGRPLTALCLGRSKVRLASLVRALNCCKISWVLGSPGYVKSSSTHDQSKATLVFVKKQKTKLPKDKFGLAQLSYGVLFRTAARLAPHQIGLSPSAHSAPGLAPPQVQRFPSLNTSPGFALPQIALSPRLCQVPVFPAAPGSEWHQVSRGPSVCISPGFAAAQTRCRCRFDASPGQERV